MEDKTEINIEKNDFNNFTKSSDNIISEIDIDVPWAVEHENILVEWADKAMCYRWMHNKSNEKLTILNAWYTIPVIIMSTLTGTANFAQERFPVEYQPLAQIVIGSINIIAGILTTIQQFLKVQELNEGHRVAALSWDKFYRDIKVELSKSPKERQRPGEMLKSYKKEFDRLMEISPSVDGKIIELFKRAFKTSDTFKDIVKPEICDELVSTNEIRHHWYKTTDKTTSTIQNDENSNDSMKIELIKIEKDKNEYEKNKELINEFIQKFIKLNGRPPIEGEIIDNLSQKIKKNDIMSIIELYLPQIIIQEEV
jgi:hypothetical protein